jgi:nucleotide-binding universal stress UspA family protein
METSMIKTILVPTTGTADDEHAFTTALSIARFFESHLQFLHVGIDPVEVMATAMVSADAGGAGGIAAEWISRLETEAKQLSEESRRRVEDFCKRETVPFLPGFDPNRISASWHSEKGSEDQWIPAYGREADLVVMGRTETAANALTSTMFDSGRPVLIPGVADAQPRLETAVIAWKPTREAARAVSAAMPLLEKCKRLIVITVSENEETDAGSVERLVVALRRHGIPVEAQTLRPQGAEPVDAMLDAARGFPGSFVVMGGYGHSRVREMIFGGFTQRILRGADVPVLIAH